MKNKQPDPVVFAQTVIHELSAIRATVTVLAHFMIEDLAQRKKIPSADLQAVVKDEISKKTAKFYDIYVAEVGLPPRKHP